MVQHSCLGSLTHRHIIFHPRLPSSGTIYSTRAGVQTANMGRKGLGCCQRSDHATLGPHVRTPTPDRGALHPYVRAYAYAITCVDSKVSPPFVPATCVTYARCASHAYKAPQSPGYPVALVESGPLSGNRDAMAGSKDSCSCSGTPGHDCNYADEHPRNLIPQLCRLFYSLGWVTGTSIAHWTRRRLRCAATPSHI